MNDFLQSLEARLVFLLAALAILVTIAVYAIGKIRALFRDRSTPSSDLITNFRQMHDAGELSEQEYRTIKGMLSEQLRRELNESGEKR